MRHITEPNLLAIAHLVKALNNKRFKGYTVQELIDVTGLNVCTVGRYLAALHQVGAAYIDGYEIDARGAYSIRRWKLGTDDDAEPTVRSRTVRQRETRHRAKLRRLNAKEAAHAVNDAGDARTGARDTAHEQGEAVFQKRDDVVFQREKQKFEGANHGNYSS